MKIFAMVAALALAGLSASKCTATRTGEGGAAAASTIPAVTMTASLEK